MKVLADISVKAGAATSATAALAANMPYLTASKFRLGDRVHDEAGAVGAVVGYYSTTTHPIGVVVEFYAGEALCYSEEEVEASDD